MVFESVCLVDMIVLGMFRADIGWKKSFENFFWRSFDEIICQKCKDSKIQAFFGITNQYLSFGAIFEKISLKLRVKKFSNYSFHPI